ncbi:MAG: glycosyltransferase family 4 protein [Bacteroidales bacterium]|nr:glycosyltransferase family 4 protein [Bacteroidales bacterium]
MSIKPDVTVSMLRREINFLANIPDGSIKVGELHFNKLNYRDFNTGGKKGGLAGFLAFIWMRQLIMSLKKIEKFVVLSYEDKQNWVKDLDNVVVIYNPLDKYPDMQSDCSSKKVIAAGRYVSQKGFDMLIDIWSLVHHKHPDWTLSIYGDGDKTFYQGIVERLGLQQSVFLNDAVNDLNSKLIGGSIFAFPSRFEGFGMAVTEAMSCGLPVVAFSCPCGPKDIINDNFDGILVEPGNIEQFAEKLGFLMENEEVRKKLGKNAYTRSKDFDIEIIASQWHQFFTELIQNN